MEAGRVKPPFEPDPHAVYAKVTNIHQKQSNTYAKIISDLHAVYAKVEALTKSNLIDWLKQKSYQTRMQSMPR